MKVFDLFCGTGGFYKGFENSTKGKYEVVFGIDLLEASVKTFKLNHEKAFSLANDIRKIKKSVLSDYLKVQRGELDVIVGGPPCQGFSSIRPFRSTNDYDPRNSLFEEYAYFVCKLFQTKDFCIRKCCGSCYPQKR